MLLCPISEGDNKHQHWIEMFTLPRQNTIRPLSGLLKQSKQLQPHFLEYHYDDVRMGAIASQITSLAIVYSAFYSGVDQRKHQSSASLAFVWGIHRDRWIPRTKGQLRGKCFHLMTSSCWIPRNKKNGLNKKFRHECYWQWTQNMCDPIFNSW